MDTQKMFKKQSTLHSMKKKNRFFRQTAVEGYDPMQIPGDINKAMQHMNASKVGLEAQVGQLGSNESLQMCQCCGKYVQKAPISLLEDPIQLSFLGSGYPMYFEFLRFCILLMCVLIFFNGLYGIITNAAFGTTCITLEQINGLTPSQQKDSCYLNWVTKMSLGNKREEDNLLVAQSFLNVISILIIVFLFQKFRLKQRQIDIDCDENDVQANDYTALFSNIPKAIKYTGDPQNFDYPEILKEYFQKNLLPDKEVEIVKVGLCFNCDKITQLTEELNYLILQKQLQIIQGKDITSIDEKILDQQLEKRKAQLKYCGSLTQKFIEDNFTGYAYVIFQRESDKDEVVAHYERRSLIDQVILQKKNQKFFYEGQSLGIIQAPDPNNINWKSLKYSRTEKRVRRILYFILTVVCLGACLSIIMGFNFAQNSITNDNKKSNEAVGVSLLSIVISICITLLNPVLKKIIILISKNEGRSTRTAVFISIAIRSAIAVFLNTSVLLILTQVLIVNEGSVFGKIFGRGGLALNINTVFLTQLVLTSATKMMNLDYIFKGLARNTLIKFNDKLKLIAQGQLNSLFEYPEFSIEEEYARNLETVYSVLFYAPIFPVCLIWGVLTLFARYWIDKVNIQFPYFDKPKEKMTECLEYCLPLYSLSNMLGFIYLNNEQVNSISIFGFLIGLLHAFLPMQVMNERLFITRERVSNQCDYSEVADYLSMNYDSENPVICDIAIEQHIFKIKSLLSNVQNQRKDFYHEDRVVEDSPVIEGEQPILKQEQECVKFNLKDKTNLMDSELNSLPECQKTKSQTHQTFRKPSIFNPINNGDAQQKNIDDQENLLSKKKRSQEFQFNSEFENPMISNEQLDFNSKEKFRLQKERSESNMKQQLQTNEIMDSQTNNKFIQKSPLKIELEQDQDLQNSQDIDVYFQNIINNSTPKTNNTKQTSASTKRTNNAQFTRNKKQQNFYNQATIGGNYNDDFCFDNKEKKYKDEPSPISVEQTTEENNEPEMQKQNRLSQQKRSPVQSKQEDLYTDKVKHQEAEVVILDRSDENSEMNSAH